MKDPLPIQFTEYWRGRGTIPKKETHINNTEELGKEWKQLLKALQDAAKKEWSPK